MSDSPDPGGPGPQDRSDEGPRDGGTEEQGAASRNRDNTTAALPFGYEPDPLAEYWESPPAQMLHPDGSAAAPEDPSPAATTSRDPQRSSQWSNRRVLAAFGLAIVVVGTTSLSLGWFWGDSGARTQPASDGRAGASGRTYGSHVQQRTPMRSQARSVDALLRDSTGARDEVVTAVVNTRQCTQLSQNIRALRAAARERERLVSRLGSLDVGAIPDGQKATASLRRAWNASARADRRFAAWAENVGKPNGCSGGTPATGRHYRQAVRASAAASRAKAQFVRLWNPVAVKVGLSRRSEDEI